VRVLFVEDHQEFARTVAAEFLGAHEVTFAADVRAGKLLLSAREFDVLLVDHDLPDGVGTDVVAHALAIGRPIDIVAVSSHDAGNAALVRAGARASCPKRLLHTIAAVLAG